MPAFSFTEANYDMPDPGIYVSQIVKAEKRISKSSGSEMIALRLKTIPDNYSLNYYLVFNGKRPNNASITQFCQNCQGQLGFPQDAEGRYDLTPADCLHRVAYVEVVHESNGEGEGSKQAKIKFAGVLAREKALARAPELAAIPLPSNLPPPKTLAAAAAVEERKKPAKPVIPDDDIPF